MNSSFPNRWSFSYLKFTKYVTNIIAKPKYKYGQQEQVTVRNHNRSTAIFSFQIQINYVLLYIIMPFETFDMWRFIYSEYGLGWQWPMLHNTLTVAEWASNLWSSCTFPYKGCKIAQVIIILRKFVQEDLISVISFLLDRHSIFICSITGFWGHRLSFPTLCQYATFIYCAKYVNTYTGKSFCWHKGGRGRGGGGRYAIKLFLIFICFIVKDHSFSPKLSPCSIPKAKLIPL